ncbi:MAG: imidazole glycerol phosphate synthase subunit HisH, partial [Candidatus Bathyarchaeia archaeon]
GADAVVLPGVGNFQLASRSLGPLRSEIAGMVEGGVPLLGVCLGMQLFFEASEEGPGEGLALLKGRVLRMPEDVKTPHMGWNTIKILRSSDILDGIDDGDHFYFAHSYFARPVDEHITLAETRYGLSFPSAVAEGNLYGVQFHPEKSGLPGERVLRNFARIVKR